MKMWESEKHRSWCKQVEGFRGQVATDGSLIGKSGKWRACRWAERTIMRAGHAFKKVIGPIKVQVDNKGIIDEVWRGQRNVSS